MIDGQHRQPRRLLCLRDPAGGEPHQGHGISATGYRKPDMAENSERIQEFGGFR
jgi:hypothetical protein